MVTYWTNFAKYGDPNGKGIAKWPAFSDAHPEYYVLGRNAAHRAGSQRRGAEGARRLLCMAPLAGGYPRLGGRRCQARPDQCDGRKYPRVLADHSVAFQIKAPDGQVDGCGHHRKEIPHDARRRRSLERDHAAASSKASTTTRSTPTECA